MEAIFHTFPKSDGDAERVQLGSPRRLKTIYQTNMQSAYMAGRYKSMMSARDSHPYWRYVAILDASTREAHRQLDGNVFAVDDPFTDVGYPPNGFNCRCRAQSISRERLQDLGQEPLDTTDLLETRDIEAGVDKRTGEIKYTQQTGFYITGSDGQKLWVGPDAGFNASPLASHIVDDLLVERARDLVGNNALEQVQNVLLSKPRMDAWQSFIRNTLDYGRQQNQTMTVGIMQQAELDFLAKKGIATSPVMFVRDNLIVGKKAIRHANEGDALDVVDWLNLPKKVDAAEKIYWDNAESHLVYLLDNSSKAILAVRLPNQTKTGLSEGATVYKKKSQTFIQETKSGKLQLIR